MLYYSIINEKRIYLKIREELNMKKYPYTDSTDLIVYDAPAKKKKKKNRILPTAILSALIASVFTAGVCGTGFYLITKNAQEKQLITASTPAQLTTTENSASTDASLTTTYKNGKQVLTVPEIASKVGPSVVGVINKAKVSAQKYYDPFSGRYYYYQDPSASEDGTVEQGSGSGIILNESGYIVTNQHVIEGATDISIILNTGDEITAKLVGQDAKTDLAVLKVDTDKELTPATLGDSTAVQVGELAVAIGNPMGMEFSGSVTAGIISAVNRIMNIDNRTYNLIQTDAAINSGNSGGALINQYGEVIGINSVKLSTSGVEGMGFAIAISEARPIIDSLMESGRVSRPYVGLNISETQYGLFIAGVVKGSGAEQAGLKANDMIMEVDGNKVASVDEINDLRDKKQIGDSLRFKILRDGETIEVDVKLTDTIEDAEIVQQEQPQQKQQQQVIPDNGYGYDPFGGLFDFFFR